MSIDSVQDLSKEPWLLYLPTAAPMNQLIPSLKILRHLINSILLWPWPNAKLPSGVAIAPPIPSPMPNPPEYRT